MQPKPQQVRLFLAERRPSRVNPLPCLFSQRGRFLALFTDRFRGFFLIFCTLSIAISPITASADTDSDSGPASEGSGSIELVSQGYVPVPEPTPLAVQYHQTGNWIWTGLTLWEIALPGLFLFTGLSARVRSLARRIGRYWFFEVAIYIVIATLLGFLAQLPLSYYLGFVRQHAYGLSNQTFDNWFSDKIKSLVLSLLLGGTMLWIPYLVINRSPKRWWLYLGLATFPFMLVAMLITPIWIQPLFNTFGPMKDKQLEARILDLADRAGIEGSRVFEVNMSEKTKRVNAYVAGFWNTKRIVLWDTTLEKLNEDEVLFIMGHEMGHFVLGHVVSTLALVSVLMLFALWLLSKLANWSIQRWQGRFGFTELGDVASLPLIMILTGLLSLVFDPIGLAYSRYNEHEADRFGLEITRDNHAAAMSFVRLQETNLSYPRPGLLYKIWRGTHPSIGERIDFFNTYRPWETDEPRRYEDLFVPDPIWQNTEPHL